MAKEYFGSVTRTLIQVGSGLSLGLLVSHFDVTPETLETALHIAEKIVGSLQGIISIAGIIITQGWSLHQKMTQNQEIRNLETQAKEGLSALDKEAKRYNN